MELEGAMSCASSACDRLRHDDTVCGRRLKSERCGVENFDGDATSRRLRGRSTTGGNPWFIRTVIFALAAVVLASQGTCLQLSIDPNSGSVRILRDRRASIPSSDSVREFRDCGGNLTALSRPARLYNPGYPKAYESNQLCRWVITADGDITLHFVNVEIEDSPGCEYDNIVVLIGPKQVPMGKMCGTITNRTIATNSTAVTVVFKSDESYEEKGFFLEFSADTGVAEISENACGDTLTAEEGNVTSPGYPFEYPDNSSCWSLINVEPGRVIVMRFKVIALEFDETCAFDYVEIFDGPTEDSPSFGRFCGDSQKRILRSTSSSVLVHFKSDDLLSNRGFLLQYESNSGGIKVSHDGGCAVASDAENGTVATPNYPNRYPASAHCLLDLEAPREAKVALRFVDFSLEPDANCTFDFVEIWDGYQDGWRSLGRLCGDKGEMKELVTSENRMRVKFYSDNFSEFRGFFANFYLVSATGKPEVEDAKTVILRKNSLVPARELIEEISPDETVAGDDQRILKCIPKVPGSKVKWVKNETVLNGTMPLPHLYLVSPSTLWIRRMHSDLAGSYTCLVSTEDREAMASTLVVMAGTKPRSKCNVFFRKSPKDQEIPHGETAIMHCTAQAPQRPSSDVKISWLRNGLPFPTSNRYRDLGNGLVYISDAMPKDSAVYTCVATDRRSNCTVQESALLRVLPRVNIEEICGIPFVGRPNMTKPHVEHGKIVGGMDSIKGAYPWQVMFWTDLRKAFCGGSLVNDQWVLTASHCFKRDEIRIDEVEVRLGKYDQTVVEPQQMVTKIADVHFHPNFNVNTFDNDIALVQLADRVTFTDFILPVCLGDSATIERDFFSSGDVQLGTVTGWGQLTESVNTLPRFLQEIRLPIIDHKTCQASTQYPVTRNMFCAGYKQEIVGDACKGDSGGPFVVQRKNRWYLIGIVSWGVGCGRKDHYGYYAKVSNYHSWIKEKILY